MKPSIPKGTRDFSPQEMVKRNYIFDIIRKVYLLHGYQPIETPAMENSETLMGKYGEEGYRLIFKILNSGDFMDGVQAEATDSKSLVKHISEKALRYDLTVPFARYVVQHRNDITFPFKRYQIQPVWRADRPQKGRYREFYQCDADVIGSDSLLNEVELVQIIDEVFKELGVPVIIKINNRKILQGIAEAIGAPDKMIVIAVGIDKLEKIGREGVENGWRDGGLTEDQIRRLGNFFLQSGDYRFKSDLELHPVIPTGRGYNQTKNDVNTIRRENKSLDNEIEILNQGIGEMDYLNNYIHTYNEELSSKIRFDVSLARGLNYYTGTIIEVKIDTSKCASQFTSSICGGGRYDDLTGIFGLSDVSGVGISFGADRIYDVMEELKLFPENVSASTKVLLINF